MLIFGGRRKSDDEEELEPEQEAPSAAPIVPTPTTGFETVLGNTSSVEGTLQCSGNIRLDGTFTGTLEITGNVLVGESAKINADLHANNISIAGVVRGNVSGKKVQLLRTARVWGDILANVLTADEGAFIDGRVSMKNLENEATLEVPRVEAVESAEAAPIEILDDAGEAVEVEFEDAFEATFTEDTLDETDTPDEDALNLYDQEEAEDDKQDD